MKNNIIKKISTLILSFFLGFYGGSIFFVLYLDKNIDLFITQSLIFFVGVSISHVLNFIDAYKKGEL